MHVSNTVLVRWDPQKLREKDDAWTNVYFDEPAWLYTLLSERAILVSFHGVLR